MTALPKLVPSRMTVEEFLDWPGDGSGKRFELVDGEPRAMAPASGTHGRIQATLARLLGNHLVGSGCAAVIEPGIVPRVLAAANMRVPDVVVTCEADDAGVHALAEPILIVEVLSPSNEGETRENVWAYTTIPTVREILLIRSTHVAAELIRRQPDGSWPATSISIGEDEWLPLESIDFGCALAAVYEGTRFSRSGES
ncbi:MAG: Uma2 family endonuclease [Alphaproteobacteria bacterium]|nr:Uma2 family endonuclease [Alphaproteobacteria bacterium]